MKHLTTILIFMLAFSALAQEQKNPLTKRIIVKTNLMNLIAKRPAISIEKFFSSTFSTEISYVYGQFNNIVFTDQYNYKGFLIRAKKYLIPLKYGRPSPYGSLYVGNLRKDIKSSGWVDNSGYFGIPARNFSASSIRVGTTFGFSYIAKNRFLIDGLGGLGYGRHIQYFKADKDF